MTSRIVQIAILGALSVVVAPRLVAQARGTLRGTITDSVTGKPVVGSRVAVLCADCYGRPPTDSAGRYHLSRLPAGSLRFEAHCPSVTGLGAEITQRTIEVTREPELVLDLRVPPGHCAEPAYSERRGVFRGYWTPGFESSDFRPCADSALRLSVPLLPGKRLHPPSAWADLEPGLMQRLPWPRNVPRDSYGNATYFVVWRGVLKGPGSYGHMGVSEFSLSVDSVLAVRARGPSGCRTQ